MKRKFKRFSAILLSVAMLCSSFNLGGTVSAEDTTQSSYTQNSYKHSDMHKATGTAQSNTIDGCYFAYEYGVDGTYSQMARYTWVNGWIDAWNWSNEETNYPAIGTWFIGAETGKDGVIRFHSERSGEVTITNDNVNLASGSLMIVQKRSGNYYPLYPTAGKFEWKEATSVAFDISITTTLAAGDDILVIGRCDNNIIQVNPTITFTGKEGAYVDDSTFQPWTYKTVIVKEYSAVDFATYRAENYTAPVLESYIFAGWYHDRGCVNAVGQDIKTVQQTVYAKFIPQDVLDVRAQLSANLIDEYESNDAEGAMRFVTTIDTLTYSNIGFRLSYTKKLAEVTSFSETFDNEPVCAWVSANNAHIETTTEIEKVPDGGSGNALHVKCESQYAGFNIAPVNEELEVGRNYAISFKIKVLDAPEGSELYVRCGEETNYQLIFPENDMEQTIEVVLEAQENQIMFFCGWITGLEFTMDDLVIEPQEEEEIDKIVAANTKVYTTLYAKVDDSSSGIMTYEPKKEFCNLSNYFKTYTLTDIPQSAYDTVFYVTPFIITEDGTRVEGQRVEKTVNQGIEVAR